MREALKNRHLRGLYFLAMDQEASAHYNEPPDGLMHRVWRTRGRGLVEITPAVA